MPMTEGMTIESISEFRERARAWLESQALATDGRSAARRGARASSRSSSSTTPPTRRSSSCSAAYRRMAPARRWPPGSVRSRCPTEFGGLGLSPGPRRRRSRSSRREFDVPRDHEVISVTSKLIAPTIEEFGTPEQRAALVPDVLPTRGVLLPAVLRARCRAATSPVWPARPSATATSGCSTARRCGRRPPASREYGFAICRTDPDVPKHAGLTAFIVPLDAAGVEVRPIKQMSGGASFNEVFLSGVRVARRHAHRRRRRRVEGGAHRARPRAVDVGIEPARRRVRRAGDAGPPSRQRPTTRSCANSLAGRTR